MFICTFMHTEGVNPPSIIREQIRAAWKLANKRKYEGFYDFAFEEGDAIMYRFIEEFTNNLDIKDSWGKRDRDLIRFSIYHMKCLLDGFGVRKRMLGLHYEDAKKLESLISQK